ncbi:MAG TPA: lipase maturation factor family protein [Pseudonocardiaceae bacterium]|nr:lipase maturation factor family protein [Pseudonocardiaceae bacterium]
MAWSWFTMPEHQAGRWILQHLLALAYVIAFSSALAQFRGLIGSNGLTPAPRYLERVGFRRAPSVFHLYYSDRFFAVVGWVGLVLSAAALAGLTDWLPLAAAVALWLVIWALYLSIVNIGQVWYGFGWESLLLEAGFLAAFLGPAHLAPPAPVIWLLLWLLFRLELGAGLIKVRGDPCWRNLTCLYYHHETQPMPSPTSWWFHHLPRPLHRVEVAANHVTQLVVPFLLFAPQPVASVAAAIVVVTQGWLMCSGNYAWLNFLTITLAFAAVDDRWLPLPPALVPPEATLADPPIWFAAAVIAVTVLMVVLAWWPIHNLCSRHQLMNAGITSVHLSNTYGAFGSVTRHRYEVVIEGTDDPEPGPRTEWREYEFKGKPGDPRRRPPQIAPYHLRLDWLMWFAALSPSYALPWLPRLLEALLRGNRDVLALLRHNPFPDQPPRVVRALLYRYRFSTWAEWRQTRAWWVRTEVGEFVPAVSLGTERAGPKV